MARLSDADSKIVKDIVQRRVNPLPGSGQGAIEAIVGRVASSVTARIPPGAQRGAVFLRLAAEIQAEAKVEIDSALIED